MFAVCAQYTPLQELVTLPGGRYLCADCTEEEREKTVRRMMRIAEKEYKGAPAFFVEQIVVSGILQWKYQVQVYIDGPR